MTRKPRILDTFCGGGGCSRGYQDAGFEVIGCDINRQPRYIGDGFYQGDALELLRLLIGGGSFTDDRGRVWRLEDFDAIHGSPPCQFYSSMTKTAGTQDNHPDLVEPVRELLQATGKPYVIENVEGAPLTNPVMLCGTMFGLLTVRHRLFETNPPIWFPPSQCQHLRKVVRHGRPPDRLKNYHGITGHFSDVEWGREVMECPWMVQGELAEAIPPAFTKWIGHRLLEAIPTANR